MDLDALHSFTFKRLQNKCVSKGLSKSGTKKQLIVRLKLYYSTNGQLLSPTAENDDVKFNYKTVTTEITNTNNNQNPSTPSKKTFCPPPLANMKSKSAYSEFNKDLNVSNILTQIHSKSKSEYATLLKTVSTLSLNLEDINNEIDEDKCMDTSEFESNTETEYSALSPINQNQRLRTRIRCINHNENKYDDDTYTIRIANRGMGLGFISETNKVIVSEVLQNSRAMFLGISKGDMLVKINDIVINNCDKYYEFNLPFTATFKHMIEKKKNRSESMPPIKKLKLFNKNTLKITDYIIQCSLFQFDLFQMYQNRIGVCFVVSKWFISPEWKIKILKCDTHRQEVGIVSNVNEFKMSNDGLINSNQLGARCFFGTDNGKQAYYASINENGTERCYSNVSNNGNNFCWNEGDVIKINLNVKKWNVSFYLNAVKVKKSISIEPNQIYYPVISFIGNCQYEIN